MNKTSIIEKIAEFELEGFTRSEAIELLKVEAINGLSEELAWLNKCVRYYPSVHEGQKESWGFNIGGSVHTG